MVVGIGVAWLPAMRKHIATAILFLGLALSTASAHALGAKRGGAGPCACFAPSTLNSGRPQPDRRAKLFRVRRPTSRDYLSRRAEIAALQSAGQW
jgi:hypothetical protein